MRERRTKTTALIAGFAIAGFLLSGCAGGQSKADACKELESGIQQLQTELTESSSSLATDPDAASEAISKLADTFSDNAEKVTNDEVKPTADKAEKAISAMSDEFEKYADDPASADVNALTESATDVQTTFTDLGKVCD